MEEFELNDEEIDYQIDYVFKHNDLPLEVLLKPLIKSCNKAGLEKLVGYINKNLKGYEDTTVGQLLDSTFWREILKAVEK